LVRRCVGTVRAGRAGFGIFDLETLDDTTEGVVEEGKTTCGAVSDVL